MKQIFSSDWRFSVYALIVFIGGIIGNLLIDLNSYFILGALSGSLLIVIINLIYVIYKNNKKFDS